MPPGIGVIHPATVADRVEGDVTDQSLVGTRDADVDHCRSRLDVLGGDHPRLTRRGDDDVGLTANAARSGVRLWATVTVASTPLRASNKAAGRPTSVERPTTTALFAGDRHFVAFQQLHHTERCARHEAWLTTDQPAERAIGQPVDILFDR